MHMKVMYFVGVTDVHRKSKKIKIREQHEYCFVAS